MRRILCCLNTRANRVEEDGIGDSLERCLSVPNGVTQFRAFLRGNRFEESEMTLNFVLRCRTILTSLATLTPDRMDLPQEILRGIGELREMADAINFDRNEMNELNREPLGGIAETTRTVANAEQRATDLLRNHYDWFRRQLSQPRE